MDILFGIFYMLFYRKSSTELTEKQDNSIGSYNISSTVVF